MKEKNPWKIGKCGLFLPFLSILSYFKSKILKISALRAIFTDFNGNCIFPWKFVREKRRENREKLGFGDFWAGEKIRKFGQNIHRWSKIPKTQVLFYIQNWPKLLCFAVLRLKMMLAFFDLRHKSCLRVAWVFRKSRLKASKKKLPTKKNVYWYNASWCHLLLLSILSKMGYF